MAELETRLLELKGLTATPTSDLLVTSNSDTSNLDLLITPDGVNGLTEQEAQVLEALRQVSQDDGAVSGDWQQASHLSDGTFSRVRTSLMDRGLVVREGDGRHVRYVPVQNGPVLTQDRHGLAKSAIDANLTAHQACFPSGRIFIVLDERLDQRVPCCLEVFPAMLVGGIVTAADVSADTAHDETYPTVFSYDGIVAVHRIRYLVVSQRIVGLRSHDRNSFRFPSGNAETRSPAPCLAYNTRDSCNS